MEYAPETDSSVVATEKRVTAASDPDQDLYKRKMRAPILRHASKSKEQLLQVLAKECDETDDWDGLEYLKRQIDAHKSLLPDLIGEATKACREVWLPEGASLNSEFIRKKLLPRISDLIHSEKDGFEKILRERIVRFGPSVSDKESNAALGYLEKYFEEFEISLQNRYEIRISELNRSAAPPAVTRTRPKEIATGQNRRVRGLSHFTRAVRSALIRAPGANGLEISRAVDDEAVEISPAMEARKILLYEEAYKKGIGGLDSRYTKIRKSMRKQGLID